MYVTTADSYRFLLGMDVIAPLCASFVAHLRKMIFFDNTNHRHELPMYSDPLHMPSVFSEEVRAYLLGVNTRVTRISHLKEVMDDSHLNINEGLGDRPGADPK